MNPFWCDINPFYGHINPFWGDINPFWGNIEPLWGNIEPLWNDVGTYWKSTGPEWGSINWNWAQLQATQATDYTAIQQQLETFLANAKTVWGAAVEHATGESFDAFAAPLLAKYGIDPSDPSSLARVSGGARSAFFLSWYDSLMAYSGMPRIDWWMGAVNWSPLITQIENP